MKKIFLLLSILLSFNAIATVKVELDNNGDNDPVVTVTQNSSSYSIYTENASGDATASTAPAKVWVPISNETSGSVDNFQYSLYSAPNDLPTATSGTLTFNVEVTTDTSASQWYLHMAVLDTGDTDYEVVAINSSSIGQNNTDLNASITVNVSNICSVNLLCTNMIAGSDPTRSESRLAFFYLSSTQATIGDTLNPTGVTGIYYQLNLGNKINSSIDISLNSLSKSDSSLKANYSASTVISDFKEVLVCRFSTNSGTGDQAYRNTSGTAICSRLGETDQYTDQATSGDFNISGLVNGEDYNLSIGFVNKYLFVTTLSNNKIESPQDIEEFINEQSCFLLSAGFQQNHYVLDYFRYIRDRYLMDNPLGRVVVDFYYSTAPQYTKVIYQSSLISSVVRALGHTAYVALKYVTAWLFIFGGLLLIRWGKSAE